MIGRDTGWQGKEGWVGLAEYQEGREKVTAWTWRSQYAQYAELRAMSLALAAWVIRTCLSFGS